MTRTRIFLATLMACSPPIALRRRPACVHGDLADLQPARHVFVATGLCRDRREHQRAELYPRSRAERRDRRPLDPDDHGDRRQGNGRQPQGIAGGVCRLDRRRLQVRLPRTFAAKGLGPTKFGDQDGYVALASCGSVVPPPTSTAKPHWSSPSKAAPITTRCNGPSARRPRASPSSTRRNGRIGCASCSRSGSVRSYPARPRPTRAASTRTSAAQAAPAPVLLITPQAPGPAAGQAAGVCYRHIGLNRFPLRWKPL